MTHVDSILLGLLTSAFFTLIWRRLDSTDKTLLVIQSDLKNFRTGI